MADITLTPVGGDPWDGGAVDVPPSVAPSRTVSLQPVDDFGRPIGEAASYHPALDTAGAVASSAASGHAADDLRAWIASTYPQGAGALRAAALTPAMLGAEAADSVADAARWAGGGYAGLDATDPASVAAAVPHVVNAVGLMGGAGLPAAEEGAAGIFGGRLSATADPRVADLAERALKGGVDPEDVRQVTGWAPGHDGKLRYEISDHAAQMTPAGQAGTAGTLGQALDHPDLYAAYPDLRDIALQMQGRPGTAGWTDYAPSIGAEKIELGPGTEDLPQLGMLLHEVQHAVQFREGFGGGGSPYTLDRLVPSGLTADARKLADMRIWGEGGDDPLATFASDIPSAVPASMRTPGASPALRRVDANFSPAEMAQFPKNGRDMYQRLGGEVEARNVEARAGLTPAERAAQPPEDTADVLPRRVISPDAQAKFLSLDGPMAVLNRQRYDAAILDQPAIRATTQPARMPDAWPLNLKAAGDGRPAQGLLDQLLATASGR